MAYNKTLNSNEIYAALANMIISQEVFSNNVSGKITKLVDEAKVDGSLYGDTKLFYATDALKSVPFVQDSAEMLNLLKTHRAPTPDCQAIKIDTFRQVAITTDDYMSKRAFADEGAFSSFNSVMLGWLGDTKKVYDATLYNTFIGTDIVEDQQRDVDASTGELIANGIADIITEMSDVSRDYNELGFLRAINPEDVKIIWNAKFMNKVKYIDLPSVFHKEGLEEVFKGEVLPARYFGTVKAEATAKASNTGTLRSLIECDYAAAVNGVCTHVFPGDLIPAGTAKVLTYNDNGTAKTIAAGILAKEAYTESGEIVCKIYTKLPPLMSGFEVGTSFYNARNLSTNSYLTFGHNSLQHLAAYPCVTVIGQNI